jgi:membrane-associated phospholipid phosphatase
MRTISSINQLIIYPLTRQCVKRGFLFILLCLVLNNINGQDGKSEHKKVYSLNYKFEIPLTAGLFAVNYYGLVQKNQKPTLDTFQINSLVKNDIWAFDRNAVFLSSSQRIQAQNISDWGLYISTFLPVLLFLDPKIRESWFDIALLYMETQSINFNLHTWAGPVFTSRIRPFVYYEEVPFNEKLNAGTTDSFFSGHVSWTAGASFFTAKVLSDYHQEWGQKRWLLFVAALIPPTFVGYFRYRGLKHFPSDIVIGTAVGAAVGVLTPHLHKICRKERKSISIAPFSGEYSGLVFRMIF